jgi:hypothetical protein
MHCLPLCHLTRWPSLGFRPPGWHVILPLPTHCPVWWHLQNSRKWSQISLTFDRRACSAVAPENVCGPRQLINPLQTRSPSASSLPSSASYGLLLNCRVFKWQVPVPPHLSPTSFNSCKSSAIYYLASMLIFNGPQLAFESLYSLPSCSSLGIVKQQGGQF